MTNKVTFIPLPRYWDELLSDNSLVYLSEINKAIYGKPTEANKQMYTQLQYHNYHKFIKPLEVEGIKTWKDLVNEINLIADKKSILSSSRREYAILMFGLIMDMAKLSDNQYEQLTQEEKDAIPEDEKYFSYGEFEPTAIEGQS